MYSHREIGITAKGIYRFLETIVRNEHVGEYCVYPESGYSKDQCTCKIVPDNTTELRGSGLLGKVESLFDGKYEITSIDLYLKAPERYYLSYGLTRKEIQEHGAPAIRIRIDYVNGGAKHTYTLSMQTGLGKMPLEKVNAHNMDKIVKVILGPAIKALKKK